MNLDGRPDVIVLGDSSLIWAALGNEDGSFSRRLGFAVTARVDVALADLTGDGLLDLAILSDDPHPEVNGSLFVARGDGDGRFSVLGGYWAHLKPRGIAAADFDGDGYMDVAVGDTERNRVIFFSGIGDGHQTLGTDVPIWARPLQIVAGELNGDARADLVVAAAGRVLVFGSSAGGGWAWTSLSAASTPSVALGDADGDGALDLAIANLSPGKLSVLQGNGDGIFGPPAEYSFGADWGPVALADWDGDGHLDVAVTNQVRRGNGDGTFGPAAIHPAAAGCTRHFTADMDGDGTVDLAAKWGVEMAVFPGVLGGGVQPEASFPLRSSSQDVQLHDLNGDGRLDLIVPDTGTIEIGCPGNTVSVALGHGDGTFDAQRSFEVAYRPTSVAVADFDTDGRPDLAVACCFNDRIALLRGRGDGTFFDRQDLMTNVYPVAVVAVDLNLDGHMDLATAEQLAGKVGIFLGNGDGTFRERVDCPSGNMHPYLVAGDLNGDSWPDLAVGNDTRNLEYVPASASLLYGSPSGIPHYAGEVRVTGSPVSGLDIADFDRDGISDLALAYDDRGAQVHYGPLLTYPASFTNTFVINGPNRVVHGDFDGDGWVDLAITNGRHRYLSVFLGAPGRTFSPRYDLAGRNYPLGLAAADLDEDSAIDLIITNRGDATASVLRNRTGGDRGGVENLAATGRACSVVLHWTTSPAVLQSALAVHVRRSTKADGPFVDITQSALAPEADAELIDFSVAGATSYWYAIVVDLRGGFVRTAMTPEVRTLAVGAPGISNLTYGSDVGEVWMHWTLPADSLFMVPGVAVERSKSLTGPFAPCSPSQLAPQEMMEFRDTSVHGGTTYWYRIIVRTVCGADYVGTAFSVGVPHWQTAFEPPAFASGTPARFRYSVAPPGGFVWLALYDVHGRLVRMLDEGDRPEGQYTIDWSGADTLGREAARGIYFARLATPERTFTHKLVWLGR